QAGLSLGDPAQVYTVSQGMVDVTVVGTYVSPSDTGGYVGVAFSPDTAREMFTDGVHAQNIAVKAEPGVEQGELRDRLAAERPRSEENTSQLQSRFDNVCRLLLERNNT